MPKLDEYYSDFSRIDLDARGGFARVAQVKNRKQGDVPEFCAFKLLRHEIDYGQGLKRFEDEMKLLAEITDDENAPYAITHIYDSGFISINLSQELHARKTPDTEQTLISTGRSVSEFLRAKFIVQEKQSEKWLPYLVVDLAPYDDSLLRQIHNQPKNDLSGLFRLPTGEVITMALQLLDVMNYLHKSHHRAYMDWKPEHIFWNGLCRKVKLIDWNVTVPFDDGPGEMQNIRDDLRLFVGAVLYTGLTFIDPDHSEKPIGPHPTINIGSPIPEIRRRYWTDNPNFYERGDTLDENIKKIIKTGLDPKRGFASIQELRATLLEYARKELGLTEAELTFNTEPSSDYFKALVEFRLAQQKLLQAQQHLIEAIKSNGKKIEFIRSFDAIKKALKNFPAS